VPLSSDLIDVARRLVDTGTGAGSRDADLRRAVPTAYHALFHMLLRAAPDRFFWFGSDIKALGQTRNGSNRICPSACIRVHPFLICAKILIDGQSLAFGSTKKFTADKKEMTQMHADLVRNGHGREVY